MRLVSPFFFCDGFGFTMIYTHLKLPLFIYCGSGGGRGGVGGGPQLFESI